MKFKSVPEFRTYIEDELLSLDKIEEHLNIFEDGSLMTDIDTDKTNLNWDWMKDDTIYLIRSASTGMMTYLYAPRMKGKKSDDSNRNRRRIYYAQANANQLRRRIELKETTPYKMQEVNIGDWDAPKGDAKWVRAVFKIDSGERLLMNWDNSPWERLK